jgi:hypothetical protein
LQNFSIPRAMHAVTPGSITPVTGKERERAEFREERLESKRKTDQILAELRDGRDERRALLEAIFRVLDRLD